MASTAANSVTTNFLRDPALLEEILTLSMSELHSRQSRSARHTAAAHIVSNDTGAMSQFLANLPEEPRLESEMHIVLDNAGFELLANIVLALYLLVAVYTARVVVHRKRMPWFVLDVTARDLDFLIASLVGASAEHSPFGELGARDAEALGRFGTLLYGEQKSGRLVFTADTFWTSQHTYERMPAVAPALYARLVVSELAFEVDLNYRKLVGGGMWTKTTVVRDAI